MASKQGRLRSDEDREERSDSRELAESVYFDHPDLHTGRTSRKQKITAAVAYLLGHPYSKAAALAGVSRQSLLKWRSQSEWWPLLVDHLKRHHDEDLEARTSGAINAALDHIYDRIEEGDAVWDHKNGKVVRKPVSARDLAITFGTLYDKRQLMRSQPTSISENTSEKDRLERLQRQFEELAEKKVNAIEGEFTQIPEDRGAIGDINGEFREGTPLGTESLGAREEPVQQQKEE